MFITISNSRELLRFESQSVVYISGEGNYSTINLTGGVKEVVCMQLGQLEQLFSSQLGEEGRFFVRIGKSMIVNREKVYKIVPSEGLLMVRDGNMDPEQTAHVSPEALRKFKVIIEKQ